MGAEPLRIIKTVSLADYNIQWLDSICEPKPPTAHI